MKNNNRLFTIFNIIGVILAITFNFLAVSLPINNKTTGELSDAYPNYFVPAGFTFSIWGVIYLLMMGFALYQAWQYQKKSSETLDTVSYTHLDVYKRQTLFKEHSSLNILQKNS